MTKKLIFKAHTAQSISKSLIPLKLPNRFRNAKTKTKTHLYKALVLPHLFYSPLSYFISSKTNQYKIQINQNKSLRFILNADRNTTNIQLHRALKMPPLNSYHYIRLDKIRDKLVDDQLYQNTKTK